MIYLDCAGLGIPREEILKQEYEYKLAMARDPSLEFKYVEVVERNKKLISKMLFGTTNYMVSYVRNTTEGLTIASNVLPLESNQEVIITSLEHRSLVNSWEFACEKNNCKLVIVDIDYKDSDEVIVNKIKNAITERTKIICCSHIDRNFGIVFPLKQISQLAIQNNIYFVVDGAQAVGLVPIKLDEIKCSMYICSFHKWCRMPVALGVILTDNSITHKIGRLYVGERRLQEEALLDKDLGSDELGTRNIALEMCLPMVIEKKKDSNNCLAVVSDAIAKLKNMEDYVEVVRELNIDGRGFVVLDIVTSNNDNMQDVFWKEYGILIGRIHNKGKHYIRVSFDSNTTSLDFHILIEALKDYARFSKC